MPLGIAGSSALKWGLGILGGRLLASGASRLGDITRNANYLGDIGKQQKSTLGNLLGFANEKIAKIAGVDPAVSSWLIKQVGKRVIPYPYQYLWGEVSGGGAGGGYDDFYQYNRVNYDPSMMETEPYYGTEAIDQIPYPLPQQNYIYYQTQNPYYEYSFYPAYGAPGYTPAAQSFNEYNPYGGYYPYTAQNYLRDRYY